VLSETLFMRVTHSLQEEVDGTSDSVDSFLLTNKKGGFYFGNLTEKKSKFNGLFFMHNWNMRKVVESIGISAPITAVTNTGYSYVLQKDSAQETIYLNHSNTLIYEVQKTTASVEVTLDCRDIYDYSDTGRIYSVKNYKGCTIVHYTKYTDASLSTIAYSFYVAIKTTMDSSHLGEWKKMFYEKDAARGSHAESYVYDAFRFIPKKGKNIIVIAYSEKETDAINQATTIFQNTSYIKRLKKKYAHSMISTPLKLKKQEKIAYQNALLSFDSLVTETSQGVGVFAGLPWFFQFWARDEAIASIAFLYEEQYDIMKKILLRWLAHSGRIANRYPESELGSADATGWMYFRLQQLIYHLQKKECLFEYFTKKELQDLQSQCLERITVIENTYMRDSLIFNRALETWMDTGADDVRDGFRIEIQALHLACYNFVLVLSDILGVPAKDIKERKSVLISAIRKNFYNGSYLFDGHNDPTIRPNIFIAAYLAPELLSNKEWELCFKKALSSLIVPGGISTIDTSSKLFCSNYTGENNLSYHRGDSWYWLTALTAIVLLKVNKSLFKKEISNIQNLLSTEILWSGVPGALAEVSSASEQTSSGCVNQAWSAALYIEFVNTLKE
jgi:glycogen debranching enzyme